MRISTRGRTASSTRLSVNPLEDRLTPAVTVRFDYTYDTSGFFSDPVRQAALERAANDLTSGMTDDLAAIVPSGGNSWVAFTARPDTGASLHLSNLSLAAGEVLIFVGARPLPGATVGQATLITPSGSATGSDAWRNLVRGRGQVGALEASPTDTALWGGSMVFDSEEEWYFGADPNGVPFGSSDFQGTALHELMHLFGFTDSNLAFRRHVSGYTFNGSASVAEYGGPVPTEQVYLTNAVTGEFIRTAPSHWSQEVLSRGQTPTMVPATINGARAPFTALDRAALRDIGWEINHVPTISEPADRSVVVGSTGVLVSFTVGDDETPVAELSTTAASSNPTLLPASSLVLGGSGASRTVTINPAAGQIGTSTIILTVTEPGGGSATATFTFTVTEQPPLPRPALAVGGPSDGSAMSFTPTAAGEFVNLAGGYIPMTLPGLGATIRTAVADIDGDGWADTVVVTGPGTPTRFAVMSGREQNVVLVPATAPFAGSEGFIGGGFVAAADIDGDGRAEIAITPDQGGGPRVTIFSLLPGGLSTRANFFGIDDQNFRGGARPALGDVNLDGTPDLLVAAGFGGGPRVTLVNGTTVFASPQVLANFFAFPGSDAVNLRNGVFAALGDISGDGYADLIFGGGPGGAPRVYILSGHSLITNNPTLYTEPVANFFVAGNADNRGGVRVAAKDAGDDAKAELVVGSGEGSPAKVRVYLGKNFSSTSEPQIVQDIDVFGGTNLPGGVYVG